MVDILPFNDTSYKVFLHCGLLMASQCKKCGALYFPPRQICVACYNSESEWVELAGTGRLAAYTSVFVAPPDLIARGYDRNNPYVVGVVELDEGVQAVGCITGVDAKKPQSIKIGTPVRAYFPDSAEASERDCLFFASSQE